MLVATLSTFFPMLLLAGNDKSITVEPTENSRNDKITPSRCSTTLQSHLKVSLAADLAVCLFHPIPYPKFRTARILEAEPFDEYTDTG